VNQADLVLTGGGLANTLIALRLADAQPQLNVMLLERANHIGGNHTWSFHGSDLTRVQFDWIKPLIEYSWDQYEVRFPGCKRTLSGSYHSLTSESLGQMARARLGDSIHTGVNVADLHPEHVILDDGTRIQARAVVDGRGPGTSSHLDVRFQKFVGRIVMVNRPHGLAGPIIMDATEDQDDGYRFFYTLPFDAQTLLIEDTRYSDSPAISSGEYGDEITRYAAAQGWHIDQVLREEAGVLPITLGGDITAFWDDSDRVPRSGLQAALFHPATGYSLPSALRLADELAGLDEWSATRVYDLTRNASERLWKRTGFYRALNRMLFLAADPRERRQVLERFYKLSPGLIARFYAGENTLLDKLRILSGKPPVKMTRAYQAVFGYRSGSARHT
jgi:lycopene beta-cyclase